MTDNEFEVLEIEIEIKMDELEDLQEQHIGETGVRFVHPLRLAPVFTPSRTTGCHFRGEM